MSLLNSQGALGKGCPVCGSPDRTCGGVHAQRGASPLDIPTKSSKLAPATVLAEATVRGTSTMFRTTVEKAEANGWAIVSNLDGSPYTDGTDPDPESDTGPTIKELKKLAKKLGIKGRSKMNKAELTAAIAQHQKPTEE